MSLRIPFIQTKIASFASEEISKILEHKVTIGHVDLNWIDKLELDSVTIYDIQNRSMIYVQRIDADFDLRTIYTPFKLLIEEVSLTGANVHIANLHNTSELNMSHFADIILELTKSPNPNTRKKRYTSFNIEKIKLINSNFRFDDNTESHRIKGFDNYHFGFHKINGSVSDFRLIADTVDILIKDFTGIEDKTKIDICRLNTFLRITDNSISLNKLDAFIGNSYIADSLVMKFDSYRDFNDFNHKIKIEGNLKNTYLHTKDLAIFDEYLYNYDDNWGITGKIKGKVDEFVLKQGTLSFGKNSTMNGNFRFEGLPNFWTTFFDLKLKKSHIDANDVKQYANKDFDVIFHRFKYLKINGFLTGFPTDFVTKADYESSIGNWKTDLNLKINSDKGVQSFEGDLETENLDLGVLTANEQRVQKINMKGHVEGNGFDPEVSEVNLNAEIASVGIENRTIRNIQTNAIWAKKKFMGTLSVKDSNVVLNADGYFNLNNNLNEFKINTQIDKINLQKLGITSTATTVSTTANLNFKGLKLDDLVGTIYLKDSKLTHNSKTLEIGSLLIDSWQMPNQRDFSLTSDLIDFKAKGNFKFSLLQKDLTYLYKEYVSLFKNKKAYTDSLYKVKNKNYSIAKQDVKFDINLKNVNPLTEIFIPELIIGKKSTIKGTLSTDSLYDLKTKATFSTFSYKKHSFEKLDYDFYSQKHVLSDKFENDGKIDFEKYIYNKNLIFDKSSITFNLDDDSLHVNPNLIQKENNLILNTNIYAFLDKRNSEIKITFKEKQIHIINSEWYFNKENSIIYKNNELDFQNVTLYTDSQNVSLNGFISEDKSKQLNIDFNNFRLNLLQPFVSFDIDGVTNSKLKIQQVTTSPLVNGNTFIKNLKINNIVYGDVQGSAAWVDNTDYIHLNADLINSNEKVLNVIGKIVPSAEEQLQLKAYLNNTNINIIEPIFSGSLTNLSGRANGVLDVVGSFDKPKVLGNIDVSDGKFRVDYLNTTYSFADKIYFTPYSIEMHEMQIHDYLGSSATVNGGIFHDYFSNYRLGINIRTKNIHALNTSYKDNNIFYGNAFVKGNLFLEGPINDFKIRGSITSLKDTKLYIPIGGITKITRGDYITFVDRKNSNTKTSIDSLHRKKLHTTGIKMDLNLFLTPDAENEIVFDSKMGDVIRGKGNGKIKLEIDTKGDFNMYGDYKFTEGYYNFTMLNAIDKAFSIMPGSTISWLGDPYGGKLNVKANYLQQAALSPLTSEDLKINKSDSLLLKRKYPCLVTMSLTGDLMTPEIGLGLEIQQTPPNLNIYLQDFKNKIATNEQELNKQVFSLVMMGRFSASNDLSAKNAISSSLGEFFSNQLTHMLSQVDENLQVDIDLNTVGADGLNALKVRLSRVFLDERLRVSVEDGFSNTGKSNPNASAAGLAGNWTVEYMLLKNGVLRLKIYNRTTQVSNATNTTVTNTSVGVSIIHTKDFDKLKELLNLKTNDENREKERKKEEPPKLETPNLRKDDEK